MCVCVCVFSSKVCVLSDRSPSFASYYVHIITYTVHVNYSGLDLQSKMYIHTCMIIFFCFIQSNSQMSEDEQIMQAIALSLGQDVAADAAADEKAKEEEEAKKKEKEEKELKRQKERELMAPVSKEELDEFSDVLLAGCLELCVSVNDSVAGIIDLISAVGKRNEDEWREKALVQIKEKVL